MPKEFEIRREVVLPGSPEDVWEAVATPAGNAAWLFPNDIDPAAAQIYEPPNHFLMRIEQGNWFNAIELVIEGRDGGAASVRYAHSGIFVEDWDTQIDAAQQHTDFYLHTLGQYLEHFRGRAATYIGDSPGGLMAPADSAGPDGFVRVQAALGIDASAGEGDQATLQAPGLPAAQGVIDYRQPNFLGIRTDDALYRFFGRNAFGAPVGMAIHSFQPGADAEAIKAAWQEQLNATFA